MRDPSPHQQGLESEQDRTPVVDLLACHNLADNRPVNLFQQSVRANAGFHDVVNDHGIADVVVRVEILEPLSDLDFEDAHALVASQLAIRGPVRSRGFLAQAFDLVLLVGIEVALEPEPL